MDQRHFNRIGSELRVWIGPKDRLVLQSGQTKDCLTLTPSAAIQLRLWIGEALSLIGGFAEGEIDGR